MKIFKTIIATLLIAGLLSIAQHHHDDFDEHDDCPVCALVQNGLDTPGDVPDVAVYSAVIGELPVQKCVCKTNSHFDFYRPRGPPAHLA